MARLKLHGRHTSTVLAATAAFLALPTAALATFPGHNGRIALSEGKLRHGGYLHELSGFEIFTVNANRAAPRRLTRNDAADVLPAYSPKGKHIAFNRFSAKGFDLFTMRAGGSHQHAVTPAGVTPVEFSPPSYSHDGRHVAFVGIRDGHNSPGIFVMRSAGTHLRQIFRPHGDLKDPRSPSWSPDGSRIAYNVAIDPSHDGDGGSAIQTMRPDGSGTKRVAFKLGTVTADPDWSPSGRRIVYAEKGDAGYHLRVASRGGLQHHTLLKDSTSDRYPVFSPDGNRLAFAGRQDGAAGESLCTMNLSGGDPKCVPAEHGGYIYGLSWQAVP